METPPPNERAAAIIRGKMAEQRLSTQELSGKLGISRQAAGRRVGGKADLTVNDLFKIAGWLGCDPKDLLP
ncbi:helix-turn-helix DNA binding domain protein [Arthrobacter phage Shambre1]|uniref:Helix-turn-helix DNA binding domain protein n=1 Tax=Arthrobacter phage Shambre1 TaxID=2927284 RepID=A0A977KNM6_9CAUD|nr:helix-turn-helix DNA binding domain protein [Arthrobacter phage Shambre1]UXE04773.1 helix-turn-helix DNA binding domain protein [Arthrobacter phage Shambre1]